MLLAFRSILPSPRAWGSDSRSAAWSSKLTAESSGPRRTPTGEPPGGRDLRPLEAVAQLSGHPDAGLACERLREEHRGMSRVVTIASSAHAIRTGRGAHCQARRRAR